MKLMTLLRGFHAVARAGTITGGARLAGVSQPTLSAQLTELERHFQVELFYRRGRRIAITPLGAALRERTHRLFELEAEALGLLSANASVLTGELRIAAVGPYNVMRLLAGFRSAHPHLHIQVATGDSAGVMTHVLDFAADLGLVVERPANPLLEALPLRRQPLWLLAPPGHALAGRQRVGLADLAGQPFVVRDHGSTTQRVFEACLARAGVAVRIGLRVGSREAVREAVARGLGLGIVADAGFIAGPGVVGIPFAEPEMATHAHLIWLASRRDARMIHSFVAHARAAPQ
ncbi:MAG: LysR family transcriptional regulator [Burkholderiales bacterium]|nr:LysR family transcriptional regulator [Burkholderiales bacterium]